MEGRCGLEWCIELCYGLRPLHSALKPDGVEWYSSMVVKGRCCFRLVVTVLGPHQFDGQLPPGYWGEQGLPGEGGEVGGDANAS